MTTSERTSVAHATCTPERAPRQARGFTARLRSVFRGIEASIRGHRHAVPESRFDGADTRIARTADTPPGTDARPLVTEPIVASPPAPVPRPSISEETVVYKQTSRRALHMTLVRPAGIDPASGRACVLFFHGGAWRRGTSQQFLPYCRLLAEHGIVGGSAEYRLLEREDDQIPVEAVIDARSAMRWLRANAAEFGIDPGRIGAAGGSSGAHLAAMTAMKSPVDDIADDLSIDPCPAALVLMNPPCDFDAFASSVPIAERRLYSPQHLMDASLPPTLILHGTADRVIPFGQIVAFQLRAHQVGVRRLKVVPFDGRGHGFFNRGKGEPGDYMRIAVEIGNFLGGLGWM
jgi:acetyl esterase/lipase